MHIAICDDNMVELSRISSLMEDYSEKYNNLITYEAFNSSLELLETLKSRHFDLFILDILMPGFTGMETAKEIRSYDSEVPIIFLTSSREYAVESYRVNAEDYILKPASKDEVFHMLNKQLTKFKQEDAYIALKSENGIVRIPFSKIVCVEVINRRVFFNLINGEVKKSYGYLSEYEDLLLSKSFFIKPHRSYLINLNYVTQIDKTGLSTTIGKTVPVSRDAFSKVKASYMKHLLSVNERKD